MVQETLLRYIKGDADEEEKISVMQWLDENPANLREIQSLRKLHDLNIWQNLTEPQSDKVTVEKKASLRYLKFGAEVLKIAAVFVIVMAAYYLFFGKTTGNLQAEMQSLYVPAGQRAELTLSDGTKVWLNANTTLTFPNRFSGESRLVTLNGEGFFNVTENKKIPFIVHTDKYNIKVWGTSFNLLAYANSNHFETSLLKGSIEILKPESDKGVFLKPDERVTLENNQLIVSRILQYNYFLWKDGLISFDNESFPEMVKKLELYFDLKIDVQNESINKYHCTGKFRTKDGIEHILKVLQLSNRFNFKIDEKLNAITID